MPATAGESSFVWGWGILGAALTNTWLDGTGVVDAGAGAAYALPTGTIRVRGGANTWAGTLTGDIGAY